jgi:uncharacterized protein YyaL (SSP411 family)
MNDQPPNKLIETQSPYLLQHAYNPVQWYPWGEEALARARDENKPILLSIGYSTCHWCHVMAQESFADDAVAALMNRHFICIKVDREERPDLDKVYITAVSAMSGSAGWPLNVFLTPDRLPFFGGTYFPPANRPGIPSWTEVLTTIAGYWAEPGNQEKLKASGRHIHETLDRHLTWQKGADFDTRIYNQAVDRLTAAFDTRAGGFSRAPKFPSPGILQFLMTYHAAQPRNGHLDQERAARALDMTTATLRAMARGGICDHLGGGFHRYATDGEWQIPHFEKMLYDNAQLLAAYTRAYRLTGDPEMADTARRTADYVLRDLQHPAGGFYAAEDADSRMPDANTPSPAAGTHPKNHKEGAFYTWSAEEIDRCLDPPAAAAFKHHSNIRPQGNAAQDPHGEFDGFNIIFQARPLAATAEALAQSETEVAKILARARQTLFAARAQRPRPHCDRKIITSWNGLMISALAQAYQAFGETRYLQAARRAADFILDRLYDHDSRSLFRCRVARDPEIPGIADDHLFFVQALLDLYESDFQPHWLQRARTFMDRAVELFYDGAHGGFFMTRRGHDPHLILRVKEDTDSVLPSAASVGALNLIRLARLTGREAFAAMARQTIAAGLTRMQAHPEALPAMLTAGLIGEAPLVQVTIAGPADDGATTAMVAAARAPRALGLALAVLNSEDDRRRLAAEAPFAGQAAGVNDRTRAWVCVDRSCRDPVDSAEALAAVLDAVRVE